VNATRSDRGGVTRPPVNSIDPAQDSRETAADTRHRRTTYVDIHSISIPPRRSSVYVVVDTDRPLHRDCLERSDVDRVGRRMAVQRLIGGSSVNHDEGRGGRRLPREFAAWHERTASTFAVTVRLRVTAAYVRQKRSMTAARLLVARMSRKCSRVVAMVTFDCKRNWLRGSRQLLEDWNTTKDVGGRDSMVDGPTRRATNSCTTGFPRSNFGLAGSLSSRGFALHGVY